MTASSVLWLLDPLENLRIRTDSSLFLMHLSQKHGAINFVTSQVTLVDSVPMVTAQRIKVDLDSEGFLSLSLGDKSERPLLDFQTVLNRLEPPVSESYLHQCRLLMFHPKVLNSPMTLQSHLEKFLPLYLGHGIPTSTGPLRAPRSGVSKPRHLFGGVGVKKVEKGEVVEELFQDFCSEINAGELRILTVGDQVFGAINKIPREGDFRSNSAHGSRMEFKSAPAGILHLCREILPKLRSWGIDFAAIDFIGKRIVEVNITSPGLYFHMYHFMGPRDQARLELALVRLLDLAQPAAGLPAGLPRRQSFN